MPVEEQGAGSDRYLLVPRVVVLARREQSYLLIKGSEARRLWPGLYNGVGGHLERGEAALDAARRELREETNLQADLWLCGTIVVDAGPIGVGLYVFTGEVTGGVLQASPEGEPAWIPIEQIAALPTVGDLVPILEQVHRMNRGDPPFSARSFYDRSGKLQIQFTL
jgi:8-oxo-dGTP diphosphatase